jgi:hypothetical protein
MLKMKRKRCRPQSDHAERSDLAKRFFIAGPSRSEPGGRRREPTESKRKRRAGA